VSSQNLICQALHRLQTYYGAGVVELGSGLVTKRKRPCSINPASSASMPRKSRRRQAARFDPPQGAQPGACEAKPQRERREVGGRKTQERAPAIGEASGGAAAVQELGPGTAFGVGGRGRRARAGGIPEQALVAVARSALSPRCGEWRWPRAGIPHASMVYFPAAGKYLIGRL
jgi:hypothetical protein